MTPLVMMLKAAVQNPGPIQNKALDLGFGSDDMAEQHSGGQDDVIDDQSMHDSEDKAGNLAAAAAPEATGPESSEPEDDSDDQQGNKQQQQASFLEGCPEDPSQPALQSYIISCVISLDKVPKKGADPAHDVQEKQLQKLATRGVVLLFNAVNKAQKQKKEAEAAGTKGRKAKVSKAGFFAELKAGAAAAAARTLGVNQPSATGSASVAGQLTAAGGGAAAGRQQAQHQQPAAAADHGWDVLNDGFPGLTGGVKMKDWDKAAAGSDEEPNGHALGGSDDDDDDDDDGQGAW
eukprot:gene11700-11844_t